MSTQEIECVTCGMKTPHELVPHPMREGAMKSTCLRCRELDAEAAKLNADRAAQVGDAWRKMEVERRAERMRPGLAQESGKRGHGSYVALAGGAALAISGFLPWIEIVNPLGGSITVNGVDNGNSDGWILLAIGAVILLSAVTSYRASASRVLWAVLGAVGGAIAVYHYLDARDRIATIDEQFRHLASVGFGIYIGIAGGAAAFIAAAMKPGAKL